MNKQRRAEIQTLIADLKVIAEKVDEAKTTLDDLRGEEQDYFDNMPEGIQMSEKGTRAEEVIGEFDDAESGLDYVDFDDVIEALERAAE